VATHEYAQLLDANELEPTNVGELVKSQWFTLIVGAFAALASYALFHLITVFPLSWITLYSNQSISEFLVVQVVGAALGAVGVVISGYIADRIGRRRTLGTFATMIAVFSGFAPTLLDGGHLGQDVFILLGFLLLGLSYGQAAGAVSSNFQPKYRYTGAALTSDLAWLIGAAFAPLVALGLSAHFGLAYVSVYLLSGAAATLAALSVNRALEARD
jgi:MFS family permease